MADTPSSNPVPSPHLNDPSQPIVIQQHQSQNPNIHIANSSLPLISSSQPQQQLTHYGQPVPSPSLLSPSTHHQQIQQTNASGLPGYQNQQNLPRSPSMSRLSQMNQLQQLNQYKQQQAIYGNFSGGNATISQSLSQNTLQQQQTHQLVSAGGVNVSRTAMMGQSGHLPMLSGPSQFNLQSPIMAPSPRLKAGLVQSTQLHQGNSTSQALQGIQTMASLNMNPQLRPNGSLAFAQSAQRINPAQLRQLAQQNSLISNQNMQKPPSSVAFMNSQLTGLPQNVQSALLQNTLSQQQWLKPMSPSAASSLRMQQQQRQTQAMLQQQLVSNQQIHHNPSVLNNQFPQITQQQPNSVNQQMHLQQQQQLFSQLPQQFQQPSLHQQQQQQPSRVTVPGGQKSISLTGSQPDAAGSGSSSQGTETTTQLLGKRKIQDLVAQVDSNAKLDPDVEDLLLEFADGFIDSVTTFACSIAKHRKSNTVESQDMLLHLERNWKLSIPGYPNPEKKTPRQSMGNDAHKRRLDIICSLTEKRYGSNRVPPKDAIPQGNNFIRPSASSEQLVSQATSQALSQMTRY